MTEYLDNSSKFTEGKKFYKNNITNNDAGLATKLLSANKNKANEY